MRNAEMCLRAGECLDTACFHAQQATEKALKAYLSAYEIEFPFIHNVEKLVELCAGKDASFRELLGAAAELTPYAVDLRYDHEFWPTRDETRHAVEQAQQIVGFVRAKLPKEMLR
jgi:HEPN domain-containing protein